MLSRKRMAFLSFAASAGIIALFGLIYLFSPTYLPHHEMVLERPWNEVEDGTQILLLSMMRAIGSGWIAVAVGIYIILFTAYKQEQRWSRWAMFGMGMITAVPVAFVGIKEQVVTDAVPPWILPVFCIIFFTVGFVASKDLGRNMGAPAPMPPFVPPAAWPPPPPEAIAEEPVPDPEEADSPEDEA